jgi:hypothetical protein
MRDFFNFLQVDLLHPFWLRASWVPTMRWVERLTSAITATQIRLAAALALAAASFLYLAVTTQTAQVGESVSSTASTTDDEIDVGSFGSAPSWHCVDVPIAIQCGGAR